MGIFISPMGLSVNTMEIPPGIVIRHLIISVIVHRLPGRKLPDRVDGIMKGATVPRQLLLDKSQFDIGEL